MRRKRTNFHGLWSLFGGSSVGCFYQLKEKIYIKYTRELFVPQTNKYYNNHKALFPSPDE
jgi:hypothetical protein